MARQKSPLAINAAGGSCPADDPSAAALRLLALALTCCLTPFAEARSDEPRGRTSLANADVRQTTPEKPWVILRRGDVQAVIVDNSAVQDEVLPDHRAGYSGVASLTHAQRPESLFVPQLAGLNFEHIHDGTTQPRDVLFEPRREPMQLRQIDEHTVELYQAPTRTWGLESCLRYAMLEDGTLELTIECIPRRRTFRNGYIGLFFASYIDRPESKDIHFRGVPAESLGAAPAWQRGATPAHGVLATHPAIHDRRSLPHDEDFPLSLVFNLSRLRYSEPWFFGVRRQMAFAQMFRPQDQVRLTQSPSGGGRDNPAWDFQFFIESYEVDRLYRFVMSASYLPCESPEQVARETLSHRRRLEQ